MTGLLELYSDTPLINVIQSRPTINQSPEKAAMANDEVFRKLLQ